MSEFTTKIFYAISDLQILFFSFFVVISFCYKLKWERLELSFRHESIFILRISLENNFSALLLLLLAKLKWKIFIYFYFSFWRCEFLLTIYIFFNLFTLMPPSISNINKIIQLWPTIKASYITRINIIFYTYIIPVSILSQIVQ